MDTSPIPHNTLSNSQRLAVNTFQSNSVDANEMRTDFQSSQSSKHSENLPLIRLPSRSATCRCAR
jgi:hypothetical protein